MCVLCVCATEENKSTGMRSRAGTDYDNKLCSDPNSH